MADILEATSANQFSEINERFFTFIQIPLKYIICWDSIDIKSMLI